MAAVSIKIDVMDPKGVPVADAGVGVHRIRDNRQLLYSRTDEAGVVSGLTNYVSDTPVRIRVRKSRDNDEHYIPFSSENVLLRDGIHTQVVLLKDNIFYYELSYFHKLLNWLNWRR